MEFTKQTRVLFIIAGIAAVVLIGSYYYSLSDEDNPLNNYVTVSAKRGSIRRTVSATGALQAVITIQVGSQVSGRIQELYADFNSVVKKGQVLSVIDPSNFEAHLEKARANLATAKASVKISEANEINRKAELISSRANVEAYQVSHKEAARQLQRDRELFENKLISKRDLEIGQSRFEETEARMKQSGAQVNQVKALIRSAKAQLEQSKANVKQATADLHNAEVNLRYTKITSPINGVVIERNVDIGQTVAASFQAPVLFLIANDLSKMQVIAQIDEADIGTISEQASVAFNVDAFPGQDFTGKISEIRLSSKLPDSSSAAISSGGATNVVTYNVIVDVDNPGLKLRPNMTANVTFTVASTENTITIANATLRYQPRDKTPKEIRELLIDGKKTPSMDPSSMTADPLLANSSNKNQFTKAQNQGKTFQQTTTYSARAIIGPSTIEQYGIKSGPKIRFPQAEEFKPTWSLLWVLEKDGNIQPRRIKIGITDGRETAVLEGNLQEGEQVVTWEMDDESGSQRGNSPFGGLFGPRRKQNNTGKSNRGRTRN